MVGGTVWDREALILPHEENGWQTHLKQITLLSIAPNRPGQLHARSEIYRQQSGSTGATGGVHGSGQSFRCCRWRKQVEHEIHYGLGQANPLPSDRHYRYECILGVLQ